MNPSVAEAAEVASISRHDPPKCAVPNLVPIEPWSSSTGGATSTCGVEPDSGILIASPKQKVYQRLDRIRRSSSTVTPSPRRSSQISRVGHRLPPRHKTMPELYSEGRPQLPNFSKTKLLASRQQPSQRWSRKLMDESEQACEGPEITAPSTAGMDMSMSMSGSHSSGRLGQPFRNRRGAGMDLSGSHSTVSPTRSPATVGSRRGGPRHRMLPPRNRTMPHLHSERPQMPNFATTKLLAARQSSQRRVMDESQQTTEGPVITAPACAGRRPEHLDMSMSGSNSSGNPPHRRRRSSFRQNQRMSSSSMDMSGSNSSSYLESHRISQRSSSGFLPAHLNSDHSLTRQHSQKWSQKIMDESEHTYDVPEVTTPSSDPRASYADSRVEGSLQDPRRPCHVEKYDDRIPDHVDISARSNEFDFVVDDDDMSFFGESNHDHHYHQSSERCNAPAPVPRALDRSYLKKLTSRHRSARNLMARTSSHHGSVSTETYASFANESGHRNISGHNPPRRSLSNTSQSSSRRRRSSGAHLTATMIEVCPGVEAPLRGTDETMRAVAREFYTTLTCLGCATELFCIADVQFSLCPICRVITPIEQPRANLDRWGLGLGFNKESLFDMQAEIAAAGHF